MGSPAKHFVMSKVTKYPTIVGKVRPSMDRTFPGWSSIVPSVVQILPAVTVI